MEKAKLKRIHVLWFCVYKGQTGEIFIVSLKVINYKEKQRTAWHDGHLWVISELRQGRDIEAALAMFSVFCFVLFFTR